MNLEKLWSLVIQSLWAPETYFKLLFLAVTSPFWWPLARAMAREIAPVLKDEDLSGRRLPPSEDPFLSIPLASYRSRQQARSPQGPRRAQTLALAPRGSTRQRGS